jgi:hypothetical protein
MLPAELGLLATDAKPEAVARVGLELPKSQFLRT